MKDRLSTCSDTTGDRHTLQNKLDRVKVGILQQDHHDNLQVAIDWLTLMKDRLSTCSDTTGDRHTLQNKLDRVKVGILH